MLAQNVDGLYEYLCRDIGVAVAVATNPAAETQWKSV